MTLLFPVFRSEFAFSSKFLQHSRGGDVSQPPKPRLLPLCW